MWADNAYNFKVPDGVKKGLLQLVDDRNNVVGTHEMALDAYTSVKQGDEIIENVTLYHQEAGHKIAAADLKYSFMNGRYA